VRTGVAKPDISSIEAFKRTLLDTTSVAHSREGPSGVYFMRLLDRLGIAEQMKPKLRPMSASGAVKALAKGEAELLVLVIPLILTEHGVEFVGPLPAELQTWIVLTAGIGTATKEAAAGRALIKFLTSETAASVIKAKGMEPSVPR
jgi:molybdate transport system substrate-binding protein